MISLIISLLPLATARAIGAHPDSQHLYTPTTDNKWSCLANPEIILEWSQVNDNFCDCPDGSDEPGTGACIDTPFWCVNDGFEGRYAPGSIVGDGVCDYSCCCDGSDEWMNEDVLCEDRCVSMKEAHDLAEREKEEKEREGKEKVELIKKKAQKMRQQLEHDLDQEQKLLSFDQREIAKFQKILDSRDQTEHAALYKQIQLELDTLRTTTFGKFDAMAVEQRNFDSLTSILTLLDDQFNHNLNDAVVKETLTSFKGLMNDHTYGVELSKLQQDVFKTMGRGIRHTLDSSPQIVNKIKQAYRSYAQTIREVTELETFLNEFIQGYNPNFNDMAVKQAVGSFQDYLSNKESIVVSASFVEDVVTSLSSIENKVNSVKTSDVDSSIKAPIGATEKGSFYQKLRSKLHFYFQDFLGVAPRSSLKPELSNDEISEALNELSTHAKSSRLRITNIQQQLNKPYGPGDILRAMDSITISQNLNEYEYKIELISSIQQIPAVGQPVVIGQYQDASLNDDNTLVVHYTQGSKCWNGPSRSARVVFECGGKNELLSVSEPEKCEYLFKVRGPLGCL